MWPGVKLRLETWKDYTAQTAVSSTCCTCCACCATHTRFELSTRRYRETLENLLEHYTALTSLLGVLCWFCCVTHGVLPVCCATAAGFENLEALHAWFHSARLSVVRAWCLLYHTRTHRVELSANALLLITWKREALHTLHANFRLCVVAACCVRREPTSSWQYTLLAADFLETWKHYIHCTQTFGCAYLLLAVSRTNPRRVGNIRCCWFLETWSNNINSTKRQLTAAHTFYAAGCVTPAVVGLATLLRTSSWKLESVTQRTQLRAHCLLCHARFHLWAG